jgi:hypothetical protein
MRLQQTPRIVKTDRQFDTSKLVDYPETDAFGADVPIVTKPLEADTAGAFCRASWKCRADLVSARPPSSIDRTKKRLGRYDAAWHITHRDPHAEPVRDNRLVQHLVLDFARCERVRNGRLRQRTQQQQGNQKRSYHHDHSIQCRGVIERYGLVTQEDGVRTIQHNWQERMWRDLHPSTHQFSHIVAKCA